MKLILHAGMPKAGSTALQARLQKARSELQLRGIAYPGKGLNHNFLLAGLMAPAELPRLFRQIYTGREETIAADFASFWTGLESTRDEVDPSIMVMSGEMLWNIRDAHSEALGKLLARLTPDIEVVIYVRRPSDYYLSATQQRLKASSKIIPVGAVRYRPMIEALSQVARKVHVLVYDRKTFSGGDICADFDHRFLGGNDALAAHDPEQEQANVSLSAEAMAIVQAYRAEVHADRQSLFTNGTGKLMKALGEADEGSRPLLRDEVRRTIDQSSPDVLWLRDRHRIVFEGIDYDTIGKVPAWTPSRVSEICVVDESARERLLLRAVATILKDWGDGGIKFRSAFRQRAGDAENGDGKSAVALASLAL